MQVRYTIRQSQVLLKVSEPTLWRWIQRAHITPTIDAANHRKHILTLTQLMALAKAHHRILTLPPSDNAVTLTELEHRITALEQTVTTLLSNFANM